MQILKRLPLYYKKLANSLTKSFRAYWKRSVFHKIVVLLCVALLFTLGGMYGIARWYISSNSQKPLVLGTSFIPAYAESFGLDAKATLDALLTDMQVKHLRLVSYWNQLEPEQGKYDFSLLDWQFEKAEAAGAKVSLSLGLRQPRWPECHMPSWATSMPATEWESHLNTFLTVTIERYKSSPALESYQLENEFFLTAFGECPASSYSRDRLIREYNLVKRLDPAHKVIISRSNNAQGIPLNEPIPDEIGISIYKRVWSPPIGRYIEYPFPAWYYAFLAGAQKIVHGKDMIIHELQAEAWPPNSQSIAETTLEEQNKSIDAKRLHGRFSFGEATGMRSMYLWGSEYWYYRLVKLNDPSLWNAAKEHYAADSTQAGY